MKRKSQFSREGSVFTFLLFFLLLASSSFSQNGRIVSNSFHSASLNRDIPLNIYVPANFSKEVDPYPVYIYLHGSQEGVNWDYANHLKPILDRLIANGEIQEMVVVFPLLLLKPKYEKGIPHNFHMYADSERNGKYASVISLDLLEWLAASYNVSERREDHGIGGFSMGGQGAVTIALKNNDKFVACICHDAYGGVPIKSNLFDLPALLGETPGPPYQFDALNGRMSAKWFGLAAAYSPNLDNPGMPDWFLDFPVDEQGHIIDSVFVDKWVPNYDPVALLQNPDVYKNDIALYVDATTEGGRYGDAFHAELANIGFPHSYQTISGGHNFHEPTSEAGLRFLDAAIKAANATAGYEHDLETRPFLPLQAGKNVFDTRSVEPRTMLKNFGKSTQTNVKATCIILLNDEVQYSDTVTVDSVLSGAKAEIKFKEWNPDRVEADYDVIFASESVQDENSMNDTLRTIYKVSLLVDDFESSFQYWSIEGDWGLSTTADNSGEFGMEESPYLTYENNANSWAMFNSAFDFSNQSDLYLSFWTKHLLADENDKGFVEISADSGQTWQQLGEPFMGTQNRWYEAGLSLAAYCGAGFDNIWLRFHFVSDAEGARSGWYIDDIKFSKITKVVQNEPSLPHEISLSKNYPNPFNPSTTITFTLPQKGMAKLTIFDLLGRELDVLVDGIMDAGQHSIRFDASHLSSGVYFYRLEAGEQVLTRKLMLVK